MWQEWLFYWVSPFVVALELWLAAIIALAFARRRLALVLSITGFVGLWIGSMPLAADALGAMLESRYSALTADATPSADAIVLLGGALATAQPPQRPTFILGASSTRIVHAAALFRAGKAKWIVIAAGNRPDHPGDEIEADAIAQFLGQLGVPDSAIRREKESRTTRENAANVRPILEQLGARRVLLVTSALHMPRALKTFEKVWGPTNIQLIPAVTDVRIVSRREAPWKLWFPSLDALLSVTKSLKEFAGLAAIAIIR
jgi:uncharacterized SAM-binding protein YcdF (DUF218 family)